MAAAKLKASSMTTGLTMSKMKGDAALGKVDGKSEAGQNVPADQDIVRGCEGWKPLRIKFHPREPGDCYVDGEEVSGNWLPPGLMDEAFTSWDDPETCDKSRTEPGAGRAGIEQGEGLECRLPGNPYVNRGSRAMLDEVIDRLMKADLGPDGFVVICHRGASAA